ncbi:MAG: B12-binding domain-containing radical SAM protein [Myxococcota bacterium]|jgi:radical SAM superfamily enzyme YgiQ (UPF0313 family)|nr:B12-binding domain-containing radical SAM protein [Myxococcota bacterium]
MKITLIQPAMGHEQGSFVGSWKMEPLSILALANLTPPHHEIAFYDDRMEAIDFDAATDLVAITVETYTAMRAYQIAQEYRRRGVKVVMGGYHATLVPQECVAYADAIVIGETDAVWPQVLEDAQAGQLRRVYKGTGRPRLGGRINDRAILAGKKYLPMTLVESGRGCKFACDFCSITAFFERSYNPRPYQDVVQEIERAGNRFVFLVDDNVVADFDRARELFDALSPLNLRWFSQGTLNVAKDPQLLRSMQRSGCDTILIGFESLSEENLKAMKKSFNLQHGGMRECIAKIRDHGIKIYGTFVFGYGHDTPELFERTLEFALEEKLSIAAFNHMQPFPGTPLYERVAAEGRLLYPKWWLEKGLHFGDIVFRPKGMEPEELRARLMDVRRRFFSHKGVLRRATDARANLRTLRSAYLYFSLNALMRRELDEKFGFPLGDRSLPMPELFDEEPLTVAPYLSSLLEDEVAS